uniref:Uncharacterized protein n=1 Tax=Cacopsylla melanoneura TaxID=428564 RepID=A0A8D8Q7C4_9HEMI
MDPVPHPSSALSSSTFISSISVAPHHRTSVGHGRRQKRAGHTQLQSGRQTGALHRVVQGWRAGGNVEIGREESTRHTADGEFVFSARRSREERAGRGRLLVCGEELGRDRRQSKRDVASSSVAR